MHKTYNASKQNSYVKIRNSVKSTHFIVRLNAVNEEKSTVSLGIIVIIGYIFHYKVDTRNSLHTLKS